jgi:SNF2 family DNA or RNA helicase
VLPARKSIIDLNWSRCPLPLFAHQKAGVKALVTRPAFALFDEMGAGKSAQVINAACFLAEADEIDAVLVVTPASVRAVWAGEFGEIDKHAWYPSTISEYHARTNVLAYAPKVLNWYVTNYEFIRSEERLASLTDQLRAQRVLVVLDESSRIKNPRASTTKAVLKISHWAARRIVLNGTPISNNPLDLWAQLEFLDPAIIGCKNFFHYRARYAVMGGRGRLAGKIVVGWQNLEELQTKIAPHCLRRLKVDCLDLPEKIFTIRERRMEPPTWKIYKQMRDECVAFLDEQGTTSMAPQTIVKIMRLAQISAGFIGGVESPDWTPEDGLEALHKPREIGREKVDGFLEYVEELLEEDPKLHLIVWCRFKAELDRAAKETAARFAGVRVARIEGGQKEAERRANVDEFQHGFADPMILFGNPQAGGLGLTLTAAHRVIYLSNDFNLVTRLQSEDRVHRPGQKQRVIYTDFITTGPDGQRTIDHVVLTALRKKQDLASWTTDVWRRELTA